MKSRSYRYVEIGDVLQPVVNVTLERKVGAQRERYVRTLAVVDPALPLTTVPLEFAQEIDLPLDGLPTHQVDGVSYVVAEVTVHVDGHQRIRARVGFGGPRRYMHLGHAHVLEHSRMVFEPYDERFSLEYRPPSSGP
jgi:hypothetical protein